MGWVRERERRNERAEAGERERGGKRERKRVRERGGKRERKREKRARRSLCLCRISDR